MTFEAAKCEVNTEPNVTTKQNQNKYVDCEV